jgi:hypothetical protein
MELPVIIEPLPDKSGFAAHFAGPISLSAEAATAEEAHQRLAALLSERLQQGVQLRSLNLPSASQGGWLPDDELTKEWLQHVQQYRAECDAADRAQLQDDPPHGAEAP